MAGETNFYSPCEPKFRDQRPLSTLSSIYIGYIRMPKNKPYSNPPRAPQTVSNTAASENVGARKNASVQETKKGARARLQRDAEKSFGKAGPTMHKAASYVDNAFAGVAAAPYTVMEMFDPKAKVGTSYNEAKGDWNLTKKLSK